MWPELRKQLVLCKEELRLYKDIGVEVVSRQRVLPGAEDITSFAAERLRLTTNTAHDLQADIILFSREDNKDDTLSDLTWLPLT